MTPVFHRLTRRAFAALCAVAVPIVILTTAAPAASAGTPPVLEVSSVDPMLTCKNLPSIVHGCYVQYSDPSRTWIAYGPAERFSDDSVYKCPGVPAPRLSVTQFRSKTSTLTIGGNATVDVLPKALSETMLKKIAGTIGFSVSRSSTWGTSRTIQVEPEDFTFAYATFSPKLAAAESEIVTLIIPWIGNSYYIHARGVPTTAPSVDNNGFTVGAFGTGLQPMTAAEKKQFCNA